MEKISLIKSSYICKEEFSTDKNDKNVFKPYHKVRDHCHYTGKFRGAAHSICNLRYKTPKEIPVVFHNGCTYDYPLKNLFTIPAEFQWNSTEVMENDWKMTGTNGTSGIPPLKFHCNSSKIPLEFQQFIILTSLKFHL